MTLHGISPLGIGGIGGGGLQPIGPETQVASASEGGGGFGAMLNSLGQTQADAEAALKKPLSILNDALSGRPHLLGADFSVADLNVAAVTVWGLWAGMDLSPHPALPKWLTACLERPAARKRIAISNPQ